MKERLSVVFRRVFRNHMEYKLWPGSTSIILHVDSVVNYNDKSFVPLHKAVNKGLHHVVKFGHIAYFMHKCNKHQTSIQRNDHKQDKVRKY